VIVDVSGLAASPLFAGLDAAALEQIARRTRRRVFEPGEALCRAGEPSDSCWVITAGLVDSYGGGSGGPADEILARNRKGASVGELGAILGEPQAETVIASIPTTALELGAGELGELVQRYPEILVNILRTSHRRLARARTHTPERRIGETVAVAAGPSLERELAGMFAAVAAASPGSVTTLDREFSFAAALTAADDLVAGHATVLLPAALEPQPLAALLREADRVVALAGSAAEAALLGGLRLREDLPAQIEVLLAGEGATAASRAWPADAPLRVVRSCADATGARLAPADASWLARHIARTKLGIALGAGGAKGYAHVGVLAVLQEAGYVVDCVAGSSIGAIVGTHVALGADAASIDATLRSAFNPEAVAEIFRTSLAGRGGGLKLMTQLLQETTGGRTFADTLIPLCVMAVDLSARAPAPQREGPLWEALLAATALAGVFPPFERDGQRLVDGLALVPVPTGALFHDGADVTVAVNLIGREVLPSWRDGPPPQAPVERRRRGVLDNLLEVMDLSQLAESARHAGQADVVITPRFGPGEWRDFHLADLFLAAGRAAAEEQLPALRSLALPANT
jgi:NTE family protein